LQSVTPFKGFVNHRSDGKLHSGFYVTAGLNEEMPQRYKKIRIDENRANE